MKMNKKGFTLTELLAIIVILGVIMSIAVVSYNTYITGSRNKYYKIAEQSMIAATEGMYEFCQTATQSVLDKNPYCDKIFNSNNLVDGGWKVTLEELENNNYMENVSNVTGNNSECDKSNSYVLMKVDDTSKNTKLEYKVHITCGDYTYDDKTWRK